MHVGFGGFEQHSTFKFHNIRINSPAIFTNLSWLGSLDTILDLFGFYSLRNLLACMQVWLEYPHSAGCFFSGSYTPHSNGILLGHFSLLGTTTVYSSGLYVSHVVGSCIVVIQFVTFQKWRLVGIFSKCHHGWVFQKRDYSSLDSLLCVLNFIDLPGTW